MVQRLSTRFGLDNVVTTNNITDNLPAAVITTDNIASNLPAAVITTDNIASNLPANTITTDNIASNLPAGVLSDGDTITHLVETVFGFTWGGTLSIGPDQGGIHRYTLNANTTISPLLWDNGQSVLLLLNAGPYTVTWPTMTWLNNGGTAPDMAATGYTAVSMWKMDNLYYGVLVGNG